MDDIYKGILLSHHSDLIKRTLIEKCIIPAAETVEENGVLTCHSILRTALEAVGQSEEKFLEELSGAVFKTWSRQHSLHLLQFFTPEILDHFLSQHQYSNKAGILQLVSFVLNLSDIGDVSLLHQVILDRAVSLVDVDENLQTLAVLAEILIKIDFGNSSTFNRLLFVKKVVQCMARCHPYDVTQLLVLVKNAESVARYMRHLLSMGDSAAVEHCFRDMFAALSAPVDGEEPCSCLAAILSAFPMSYLMAASKSAVLDMQLSDDTLERIFRRLLEWLLWPSAKNLDLVVIHYMKALEYLNKRSILIRVSQQVAYKLFQTMRSTMWCQSVFPVLLNVLLSYQHSPDIFHSIVPCVPFVLECLFEEKCSNQYATVASQLIALTHTLMEFFTGFPEIYNPVLSELQKYPKCDPVKVTLMKDYMLKNKWVCKTFYLSPSSLTLNVKSSTGKVGLCNLGNTCYANSVLQALYMNDEFRNKILTETLPRLRSLFGSLQNVFMFLTHSQRAAYSPTELLKISKPPWFPEGQQQDSSEYLRYFMDKLHEQDNTKCVASSSGLAFSKVHVPSSTQIRNKEHEHDGGSSEYQRCLIHDLFGGQLEIAYRCFNCQRVSCQNETFIDLALAVAKCPVSSASVTEPETKLQDPVGAEVSLYSSESASNGLKLEDLLQFYFAPEKLQGDNCYHCENCTSLQEAQKTIRITQAPKYLILTLLRFSYDATNHRRTKILQNVEFPEVLHVPVSHLSDRAILNDSDESSTVESELYSLYAVVMHSGMSSDSGHYYTYACHSNTLPELFCHEKEVIKSVEERSWYLFNDGRVTYSQFKSFCNISHQFSSDTAYLLFYRKITTVKLSDCVSEHDPKVLQLSEDLLDVVNKDNLLYLQELEDEARREEEMKKSGQKHSFWRDFDDKNPPGSCGDGSGFGGIGISTRFVC